MSLSPLIHFGTSTWAYEGWQGLVYHKPYPKKRFKQDCLGEYASYEYMGERLFRTVGFDFTFYGPPSSELLRHYAGQLPSGFRACTKVWEEITVPVFPSGLRYVAKQLGHTKPTITLKYYARWIPSGDTNHVGVLERTPVRIPASLSVHLPPRLLPKVAKNLVGRVGVEPTAR